MKSFYAWPGALAAWNELYTHTIPQFHSTDEKSSSFLFINRIKLTTITRPNELNECVIIADNRFFDIHTDHVDDNEPNE